MSLVKKFATVASGTLMSRVLGFAREMLMAAALGTGPVADAFYAAFQFPNTFRRLFAEGAFNAAFVPLFAKEIEANGADGAQRFSEEVFGVLFSVLPALTILMELSMPLIVATVIAPGFTRRSGEVRPDGDACHDHVPLPDLHVAGGHDGRHAEFAAALFRRGGRAGLPQHHPGRRAGLCLVRRRRRRRQSATGSPGACWRRASCSSPSSGSRCATPACRSASAGRG